MYNLSAALVAVQDLIKDVCPNHGLYVAEDGTIKVDFKEEATEQQREQATIIASSYVIPKVSKQEVEEESKRRIRKLTQSFSDEEVQRKVVEAHENAISLLDKMVNQESLSQEETYDVEYYRQIRSMVQSIRVSGETLINSPSIPENYKDDKHWPFFTKGF